MAIANNTIKTRIQLKSDTEANWNKAGPKENSTGFVPLNGELIIYSADNAHPFSRLKVGDGVTNVVDLPFIDSGTINGEQVEVVKKDNFQNFPSPGSPDKLYIDLSNNSIYHYESSSGYTQLINFNFSITKTTIKNVVYWGPGAATKATVNENILQIKNGIAPQLLTENISVVTDVTQGGENE